MTKRMLIDDTQPEETRVVVVNGNKLEEVEFESSNRKQIKGNIYLGKIKIKLLLQQQIVVELTQVILLLLLGIINVLKLVVFLRESATITIKIIV